MRLVLRALAFATGLLIGGEALRRWLERHEAEAPAAAARHLRSVPAAPAPAPSPAPARATSAAIPDPAAPAPKASRATKAAPETKATSKAALYKRAKALGVEGRSKMTKAELATAIRRIDK